MTDRLDQNQLRNGVGVHVERRRRPDQENRRLRTAELKDMTSTYALLSKQGKSAPERV